MARTKCAKSEPSTLRVCKLDRFYPRLVEWPCAGASIGESSTSLLWVRITRSNRKRYTVRKCMMCELTRRL
jgi:hypothetical protein